MTDGTLEEQATAFAQRLENMLTEVLGETDDQYTEVPQGMRTRQGAAYVVKSRDGMGIPLTVDDKPILRLSYRFQCSCRDGRAFLQVDESSIALRAESDSAPIFHYDFVRNVKGFIPAAHINIHASNDSATKAMLACGAKSQGRNRRKNFIEQGSFPTFSTLHFPVDGDRLRPGLEDVLQMAVYEFGIDVRTGWLPALERSRAEYRTRQLRALIREFPDIAYDELKKDGHLDGSGSVERPVANTSRDRLVKY